MEAGSSASSWCEMISGWRRLASCERSKSDLSKHRIPRPSISFESAMLKKCWRLLAGLLGALPDHLSEVSQEQKSFITQSVAGLAEDGKVVCVRLALFAEMMKGKSWTQPR